MSELVEVAAVHVGVRRREDLGDLTGLMESMRRLSLIHPIVVTEGLELVAGGRRLEAAKRLGWKMIDAKRVSELSEAERREVELEENLHRKDLTAYERSKTLADLAALASGRLKNAPQTQKKTEESEPNLRRKPEAEGGGASSPADKVVAKEIGVSASLLSVTRRHLELVARYPELGAAGVARGEAVRLGKKWDAMNSQRRYRARKAWREAREATPEPLPGAKATPAPKAKRQKRQRQRARVEIPPTRGWYILIAGLRQVITDFEHGGGLAPLFPLWDAAAHGRAQAQLADVLAQLQRLEAQLKAPPAPAVAANGSGLRLV